MQGLNFSKCGCGCPLSTVLGNIIQSIFIGDRKAWILLKKQLVTFYVKKSHMS